MNGTNAAKDATPPETDNPNERTLRLWSRPLSEVRTLALNKVPSAPTEKTRGIIARREVKLFEFTCFVGQMERAKLLIGMHPFKQGLVARILSRITFTALLMAGWMHPLLSLPSVRIATVKFTSA